MLSTKSLRSGLMSSCYYSPGHLSSFQDCKRLALVYRQHLTSLNQPFCLSPECDPPSNANAPAVHWLIIEKRWSHCSLLPPHQRRVSPRGRLRRPPPEDGNHEWTPEETDYTWHSPPGQADVRDLRPRPDQSLLTDLSPWAAHSLTRALDRSFVPLFSTTNRGVPSPRQ
jgi:hypothetical protein